MIQKRLNERDNLVFGEYYLEAVIKEKLENAASITIAKPTHDLTVIIKECMEEKIQNKKNKIWQNLQKKFQSKAVTYAKHWIHDYINECARSGIMDDKNKIEILKLS